MLEHLSGMETAASNLDRVNPLPDNKNFRLVQIETDYRQHLKVHLK